MQNYRTNKLPNDHKDAPLIFALDIGTRSVIGVVGYFDQGLLHILDVEQVFHSKRAMMDGQIEDIQEVSACVTKIKQALEQRLQVKLTKVSIAAAGRALKTELITLQQALDPNVVITKHSVHNLELKAVQMAQQNLIAKNPTYSNFYCVGYSVTNYLLDDYEMSQIIDHKGSQCQLSMIVAFLPKSVVESLYAAMDSSGLEVASLTLEPIAAMNVIIPKELRMLNLALVDIGAGTSDIAISKNGTVIAYDMVTVAGDEVSETIMRKFLVDFQTAENIKLNLLAQETLSFTNILGFEQVISGQELLHTLAEVVGSLVDQIADKIIEINHDIPAAVFLVGGGSLFPELRQAFAEKLSIDVNRIAVGNNTHLKKMVSNYETLDSPEFITPVGIAITSASTNDFAFSTVRVNGRSIRQFSFDTLTVADVLILSGHYKYDQLIGYAGNRLRFTFNGQPEVRLGELGSPAEIIVNGLPAQLDTLITNGDDITLHPAKNGANATLQIEQLIPQYQRFEVMLDDIVYIVGTMVTINGEAVDGSAYINDGDTVELTELLTLDDLLQSMGDMDADDYDYLLEGKALAKTYLLQPEDDIQSIDKLLSDLAEEDFIESTEVNVIEVNVADRNYETKAFSQRSSIAIEPKAPELADEPAKQIVAPEPIVPPEPEAPLVEVQTVVTPTTIVDIETAPPVAQTIVLSITLNDIPLALTAKEDDSPYMLFDLLNHIDPILLEERNRVLSFKINGHEQSSFTTLIRQNDIVEIR